MPKMLGPKPGAPSEIGSPRALSKTAGIRVSPLIMGRMSIGDASSALMDSMNKKRAFELLDAFYGAGGNFIDTANNYQNEQSEEWIGEWIGEWMTSRKLRNQIVIATKFTTDYKKYEAADGKSANYSGNHKRRLHVSVKDSLRKLQTDWIDILYVHWWDYMSSIEEVMDSLHILVQQGKVLYLGVSDTPAWVVSAANYYATSHGKTPFSIYQGKWNVLNRDFERDIIPMARHFGMALAPWDVMGGGRFQSKKTVEERKKNGEGLRTFVGGPEQTDVEVRISEALAKVAEEHGTESVAAIAIAYVRSKAKNVFPLVGERKIEHLKQNIEALSIKLTPEQIEYLESIVPFDTGFPNTFIVLNTLTQKYCTSNV
ncbi:aldo/keto reductase [Saccharomyces paradoxus]|uniref:Aldo/keto reductase n=1 Tax=Saccharomyces paradoxus TaxID=27291 RepID=A0A8B8UL41_SACPA|nr:Aad3 [Saccharomyces paradoxus]QHS71465.1 Aad3 [Saccharomyces paradoxus]